MDGQNINGVDLRSLRAAIAFVSQDVFLFAGTIRDNIELGRPGASDEEIRAAARDAHAHDFIMGFSAGGEVAALASTRFEPANPGAADPVDRQGSRPDFQILIYPGIHAENFNVTADTPKTFLLCADNDRGPSNALATLYPMLKKAGVPTEIHVYASGGHGFGIREKPNRPTPAATSWYLRLGDWMADQGLL
jgi:acetyl esterase/lipase